MSKLSAKELYEAKETFDFVPTKTECINLMEAYHAATLAAIRKEVEVLIEAAYMVYDSGDIALDNKVCGVLLTMKDSLLAILDRHNPTA